MLLRDGGGCWAAAATGFICGNDPPLARPRCRGRYAVAAGAIVWSARGHAGAARPSAVALNVVLFAAYLLIGVLVVRTQVARRPMLGGWSLSGLALGSVFVDLRGRRT